MGAPRPTSPRLDDPAWAGVVVDPKYAKQVENDWKREDVRAKAVKMAKDKGIKVANDAALEDVVKKLAPAEAAALMKELPDVRS